MFIITYRDAERLHDVVTAIRHASDLQSLGHAVFPNGERHLKSGQQLLPLFRGDANLIARSVEVADRCTFSLDELRYEYPEELAPQDVTPIQYLTDLTRHGATLRYPKGVPGKGAGSDNA